ncbi:hypothetical protein BGZ73_005336 [Actinomortierella ambigua]|nr:hypothetical protein BGZ73_005336 [Actinomortierella ambigua]
MTIEAPHAEWQGQPMRGQIVHARKCYKRLFFIDLRLDESRKYQILFRSDDDELREDPPSAAVRERLVGFDVCGNSKTTLSDLELAKLWKRVRRGDWIELVPFLPSKAEQDARSYPVFQATDFVTIKAWHGNQSFASEPAIGMEVDEFPSGRSSPSSATEAKDGSVPPDIKPSDSWQGLFEPNVRPDKPYRRKQLMDVIRRQIDLEAGGDGQYYKRDKERCQTRETPYPASTKAERQAIKKKERESFVIPHLATILDDQFAVNHGDLLEGASIILGMHPDQATEPIVDMALKHGKPFAVVPCCVFAVDNPHRRLLDGCTVNTTTEFVEYLVQKTRHEAIQAETEFLSFEGMNIVVFRRAGASLAAKTSRGEQPSSLPMSPDQHSA